MHPNSSSASSAPDNFTSPSLRLLISKTGAAIPCVKELLTRIHWRSGLVLAKWTPSLLASSGHVASGGLSCMPDEVLRVHREGAEATDLGKRGRWLCPPLPVPASLRGLGRSFGLTLVICSPASELPPLPVALSQIPGCRPAWPRSAGSAHRGDPDHLTLTRAPVAEPGGAGNWGRTKRLGGSREGPAR